MIAPRDHLAVLLVGDDSPTAFSASRSVPTKDLALEVRGVGPIELPVSQATARQLCQVARPARYGQGERTVLDRAVRDTWEIPKSRVKIDARRWNKALQPALDRLGGKLGLSPGSVLRAELHSMLIYARGQFFLGHQDSEKDDAMIGSLVVGLPSDFKGGALQVQHGAKTSTYRGSAQSLSLVAFYSDCRHEVKPVTSGHRIVLTYNLLLRPAGAASDASLDAELIAKLADCLRGHFAPSDGPDRLVYLLDHEYTRRGLGPARLKRTDAQRARLLGAAAELAECDHTLALADIHETWSAVEPEPHYRGWNRWDDDDEDDEDYDEFDEDGTGEEYDLDELIDSDISLDSWIGPSGRVEQVQLSLRGSEVCAGTPSEELEPYSSEYEGYMGNWGNTLDRWYHRGAVVVWPRTRAFAVLAEAMPAWALDELAAQMRLGDSESARAAAASLAPLWGTVAPEVQAKGFLAKVMRVARIIDEPQLATMLLQPFRLQALTPSHAKAVSALTAAYGEEWAGELVALWSSPRSQYRYVAGRETSAWTESSSRLCVALGDLGDSGASMARHLLGAGWQWAENALNRDLRISPPSQREEALLELAAPLAAIIQCASSLALGEVCDRAVGRLRSDGGLAGCALAVLRALPRADWPAIGVDAVAAHCRESLINELAGPERSAEDWSIDLPAGCDCDQCETLCVFLADPTGRTYQWPLAKAGRGHIRGRIDSTESPVTYQTRRVGRPYTLILTKTVELFEREAEQRRSSQEDLIWLVG